MGEFQTSAQQIILYNAIFGAVIGIIPLLLGIFKRRLALGVAGLVVSTIGGALAGIFLAVPAVVLFVWLVLRNRPKPDGGTPDDGRF